jgi:transposase
MSTRPRQSPHLLREPLLAQALRKQGTAGRTPGSEEEPRIHSEARRESHEAACRRSGGTRPYLTLQERCDYVEAITGLAVSRSTMCRAIARIGPTRKKGDESPRSATSSRGQPGGG